MRVNQDHRVMSRATTQGSGPRVENAVDRDPTVVAPIFRILLLQRVRGIVADEKIPPYRVVFAREAVERRNVIVVREPVDAGLVVIGARELAWISASLQQKHRAPRVREPGGEGPTPGPGTDDDVIERAVAVHQIPPSVPARDRAFYGVPASPLLGGG